MSLYLVRSSGLEAGVLDVPTLILVGDADILDVHAHAGAIETAIPNWRRIGVSDVGHLMYIEKPEEFLTIVTQFLEFNRFEERPAKVQ